MGLFDTIQNIIGDVTGGLQGPVDDIVGGITENPVVQDVQEHVTTATDGAAEAVTPIVEQGQTIVDDITQKLGL